MWEGNRDLGALVRWVEAIREDESVLKDTQEVRTKTCGVGLRPLRREQDPSDVPLEDGFGGIGSGGSRRRSWRIEPAASAREMGGVQDTSAATVSKTRKVSPSSCLLFPLLCPHWQNGWEIS